MGVSKMPNGDQCNNEGAHLIKKAEDDKKKADKAEKNALNAVNAAKGAKINFGDYVVSSLDGKSCGYFYNTQVWKNAQNKIKNAETHYTKKKAEAQAAAKGVTTAKEEAKVLVDKCKCTSKQAIEKAIADFNAKSKAANTAAWKKSYHMICVLDAKPANKCTVPTLPEVKPVPFGAGVKDSCKDYANGKPVPKKCETGFSKYTGKNTGSIHPWSKTYASGGKHTQGKKFRLIRLPKANFDNYKASEDKYVNMCRKAGLWPVGCGDVSNHDSSGCPQAVAMPVNWSCNMMTKLKGIFGNSVIALQTGIGKHTLYAVSNIGQSEQPNGNQYYPVCAQWYGN